MFIFFLSLWMYLSSLLDTKLVESLFFGRTIFAAIFFAVLSLYLFVKNLASDNKVTKKSYWMTGILSVLTTVVIYSNLVLSGVNVRYGDAGQILSVTPLRGSGYVLIITLIIGFIVASLYRLFAVYKKSNRETKQQVLVIALGLFMATVFGVTTNIIAPNIIGSSEFARYAPLSVLILSVILSYAIIRHKFLDIRLLVARSITYALLLFALASIYGLAIFNSQKFVSTYLPEVNANTVNTFLAVMLAFTFQPLKKVFDKLTRKLFYKDGYDSQEVLNEVGGIISSTMELDEIGKSSIDLIDKYLNPEFVEFVVLDEGEIYKHIAKDKKQNTGINSKDILRFKKDIYSVDSLNKRSKKKKLMDNYNISISVRLKTKSGVVGYILLGPKLSGNIYNSQDIDLLSVISHELAISVENARNFEQIQAFNETLQQKVKEATTKLRKTNEKLRELDEAKDEFISMASHQLRTPLTTIKGYLSMILEGDVGRISKKQRKLIDNSYGSAQRMVYLISDLLNVSRLSTGKFVIDAEPLDLVEVAQSEINLLERHLKAKEIKLEFNHPKEVPILNLDEGKIRQVIMNFIDNAIYYTPEKGKIEVNIDVTKSAVEFRVIDDGIGVPKEQQPKLFTKFFRADNAKKARPDGTGLGLFLAKKVVVAQGGAIIFNSKEGEGSTFGFRFPIAETAVKPEDK